MPDVLVRNIEEKTLSNLKKRAEQNNRSLQAELKSLLELYAGPELDETKSMVREVYMKYKAGGKKFSDSAEELSRDREE
ncbi:FitA-like ribbon-helix-helix domain-containing protein [Gracilimonas sp.]|uniref:FitA-like ribbon-helix-helix domain-containing protein n=1 Tax=Gracilimonas sp. TaxID=1974203 RepID=UPI003D0F8877